MDSLLYSVCGVLTSATSGQASPLEAMHLNVKGHQLHRLSLVTHDVQLCVCVCVCV